MSSIAHNYDHDDADPAPRDVRAATEPMITVRIAPDMYQVHTGGDAVYHVDARDGACDCDDFHYRAPDAGCKHIKRVRMIQGDQPIPPVEIDELLDYQRHAGAVEGEL